MRLTAQFFIFFWMFCPESADRPGSSGFYFLFF